MMWNAIKHDERTKLVLAYIVFPLVKIFVVVFIMVFAWDIPRARYIIINTPFWAMFLTEILFLLPPSLMRFVIFKRGIGYSEELYFCVFISLVLSILFVYLLTEALIALGVLGILSIYNILSYEAVKPNTMSKGMKFSLMALTALVMLFYFSAFNELSRNGNKNAQIKIDPYFALCAFYFILNSHRDKNNINPQDTTKFDNGSTFGNRTYQSETRNGFPFEHTSNEYVSGDISSNLVNIGLAYIGRKTRYANKYMTLDVADERLAVEHPFLTLLADRYKGAAQHTAVAKHFMIFKEMCLFISYSSLLKQDAELHDRVRTALKALLLDELSQDEHKSHNEYWRVLSKNFYDAFVKTKNMKEALNFSFWSTLAMKYPEWVRAEDAFAPSQDYIFRIFRFSYDALKKIAI